MGKFPGKLLASASWASGSITRAAVKGPGVWEIAFDECTTEEADKLVCG